jgi:hypothetical protein
MEDESKDKVVSPSEKFSTSEDYYKQFAEKPEKTLDAILDIRKFEIDLYWKRTTYHWAFIAAIITGYFIVTSSMTKAANGDLLKLQYFLICLGIIFSTAWYFVNRGSKYWQNNWESHLDVLEDKVIGPLYKTNLNKTYFRERFWHLLDSYPFSPTKINHLLSLFMIFVWISLLLDFCLKNFITDFKFTLNLSFNKDSLLYILISIITIVTLFVMFTKGRTGKEKPEGKFTTIDFVKRGIKNK